MGNFEEFLATRDLRHRTQCFQEIGNKLLELNQPLMIVETGCMRPPRVPGAEWDDGHATLIWDWLARTTHGHAVTIDNNETNCRYAIDRVSDCVEVICGDSIHVLSDRARGWGNGIDLLYLDSLDWKIEDSTHCILHHTGELAAGWHLVKRGGIIAVDDCSAPFTGKHTLIRVFLEMFANVPPILLGPICAWKKP